MKTIQELNPHSYPVNHVIGENLLTLFTRLMRVQEMSGFNFEINSGLRSNFQQQALIRAKKTTAVHSKHIIGAAADINDPNGDLASWVAENLSRLETVGLWMEDLAYTNGWVHFQIIPPASGRRVFIP